ncbi:MAG: SCP2 sterol-binding domain-containing protein, partial [Gemmatimonadales bacterium]
LLRMATDLFSDAGAARWQSLLNRSTRFADAAADWSGSLLLVEEESAGAIRRTWVRIGDGKCLEARPGEASDFASAEFVLTAAPRVWQALVAAETTPAMAAMTGKLKLTKGEVFALIPHARAAAELLAAAALGDETPS